jgi:tRNA A37 threonylcarbamoyladenosine dehydratase
VIGCSGTGTPLIEQLVRLGVGFLVLVDPDRAEWKNLNRMYLTKAADASLSRLKVEVLPEAIGQIGLGTEVLPLAKELATPDVNCSIWSRSTHLIFNHHKWPWMESARVSTAASKTCSHF